MSEYIKEPITLEILLKDPEVKKCKKEFIKKQAGSNNHCGTIAYSELFDEILKYLIDLNINEESIKRMTLMLFNNVDFKHNWIQLPLDIKNELTLNAPELIPKFALAYIDKLKYKNVMQILLTPSELETQLTRYSEDIPDSDVYLIDVPKATEHAFVIKYSSDSQARIMDDFKKALKGNPTLAAQICLSLRDVKHATPYSNIKISPHDYLVTGAKSKDAILCKVEGAQTADLQYAEQDAIIAKAATIQEQLSETKDNKPIDDHRSETKNTITKATSEKPEIEKLRAELEATKAELAIAKVRIKNLEAKLGIPHQNH